ncbi:hypothetical protein DP113_02985 [Brasilonema octagenarum UFV-E1]|uniref:Uncharacterized protein n=2 Tax=Brasilonema TaxID=383614 RepID=A0A856M9I4_9CYAN|nr:hypothetical protein [Brasilonema octagenarum UFV-OR1]QDL07020.1 hypothetical protein DP114_03030 [Brasilonema sennae CENA114]QDL13382.1 hypothetical protein DP113_02985 [Brasilonema octagenarum UFV-E1]
MILLEFTSFDRKLLCNQNSLFDYIYKHNTSAREKHKVTMKMDYFHLDKHFISSTFIYSSNKRISGQNSVFLYF